MKRGAIIVGLAAFVIWCSGCRNIRSVDADLGGLEIEYWPSHPSQEDKSIFDFGVVTNRLNAVPVGWDGPLLMPRNKEKINYGKQIQSGSP